IGQRPSSGGIGRTLRDGVYAHIPPSRSAGPDGRSDCARPFSDTAPSTTSSCIYLQPDRPHPPTPFPSFYPPKPDLYIRAQETCFADHKVFRINSVRICTATSMSSV